QRRNEPCERRRAHVARQLRDSDVRIDSVELFLLQAQVVQMAPAVSESKSRSGVIEGEVVVEVVARVAGGPQPQAVDRAHGSRRRGAGDGQVPLHSRGRLSYGNAIRAPSPSGGEESGVRAVAVGGFAARTLEPKDSTKVNARPTEPSDEPLLHEAVAAMSERTVYFRFFT